MRNPTSPSQNSGSYAAFRARNATLSRRLLMALVVFCAAMMLLGPTIADSVLSLLRCQPGNTCGAIGNAIGGRFAAFYRAGSLVDVPFIFIQNFWFVVLAWVVLIAYVRLRQPPPSLAGGVARVKQNVLYERSAMYRWTRRLAQATLICLMMFCILLGTPLLATATAGWILSQLGCEVVVLNFGGPQTCLDAPGFWTPRLRDYMGIIGGLAAPFLLIVHFHFVLIGGAVLTATLFYLSRLAGDKKT